MYVCEACGSTSEQPGTCTGPEEGYPHEPVERVAETEAAVEPEPTVAEPPVEEPRSVLSSPPPSPPPAPGEPPAVEVVDPANGTEEVPQ